MRDAAIDKQFGSGNEGRIAGSKVDRCPGDVFGLTHTSDGNLHRQVVEQALLLRVVGAGKADQTRGMYRPGRQGVDANRAALESLNPAASEVANRGIGSAVDAEVRGAHDAGG